jgi:uncharacterized protein affecting Mg2+/Co2+ transport
MRLLPLVEVVGATAMLSRAPALRGQSSSHPPCSMFSADSPSPPSSSFSATPFEGCVVFSTSVVSLQKFYCVGPDFLDPSGPDLLQSGSVFVSNSSCGLTPCHPVLPPAQASEGPLSGRRKYLLRWLEEYLRRLQEGVYRYQPPDLTGEDTAQALASVNACMISLYPMTPLYNPPSPGAGGLGSAEEASAGSHETRSNIGASRSVTRNVEVLACPAFIPEKSDPPRRSFFWSYSLRLRLLPPDHPDYDPAIATGAQSCQLASRHWVVFEPKGEHPDHQQGHSQRVDGEGVIGLYPLLQPGGGHSSSSSSSRQGEEW